MRVYEFCKQHNLQNKEVVAWLKEAGFDVKSHMAVLTEPAEQFLLKKILGAQEKPKTAQKEAQPEKETKPAIQKVTPVIQKPQSSESAAKNVAVQVETKEIMQQTTAKTAPRVQQGNNKGRPGQRVHIGKKPSGVTPYQPRVVQQQQPQVLQEKIELPVKPILLGDLADKINRQSSEIIILLLRQGKVVTKNQILDEKMLRYLATQFGFTLIEPADAKAEVASVETEASKQEATQAALHEAIIRPPIVVVIGHVDHGKTSFLDYVRKTRVASREKGGITQHLGAYEAITKNGKVVFLDTPGHEAFIHMRKRGLSVADIAILMVAADDGVMPQTVEAINHAKQANVPVIVALNKIDKVDATQIEKVKGSLAQYGLLPEEWGGQTIVVNISAKTGENIDHLLDMLALQSEIMELRARTEGPGQGYVLESKMEKGRGAVATVLLQNGQLKVGDYFSAGTITGKVSSMINSAGERIMKAGPAVPVQVSGFDTIAQAGDEFIVIPAEQYRIAKSRSGELQQDMTQVAQQGQQQGNVVRVILKVDTNSSKDALVNAVSKLTFKQQFKVSVVATSIGNINEGDVQLASTTKAIIYGFGVKPESGVMQLAQRLGVTINLHYIIYHLIDDIVAHVKSLEQPEKIITRMGEAVVRKIFEIKGVGVIAGCYVKEGKMVKGGKAIIHRGPRKIGEGEIESLQRDKRVMKEVAAGFECAFLVKGHNDFIIDDRIECFIEQIQPAS